MDVKTIREAFPILHQQVNGKPLIYFDNAATNQKPISVIQSINDYYSRDNANIHRGNHSLADRSTANFEETRSAIQQFIKAKEADEIIFTSGTTESINLVASTYGRATINKGDEIIISGMEHHSNIVPWQLLCEEKGAILKVIPVTEIGEIDFDQFRELLSTKTKIVSIVYASNSLGSINPIKAIIEEAHQFGAVVLIDGAQASAHLEIDVVSLDCDFFALSAHKMYGPTGVGILYGKRDLLEAMPPYKGGGEMIKEVSFIKTTYNDIPYKFEAGTPNIADVIAFKKAIEFINDIGKEAIAHHENELLVYATEKIKQIDRVKIIGEAKEKVSVLSFVIDGIHHFDIGQMMDAKGIAVRTGHHCTQPLMHQFGIEGTVRASFSIYNTKAEIDEMIVSLEKIITIL
ncbi:MAG: cysteine desulfurase [Cyclobacteriaceae bacterium]|nr:cysteine desulfurase [Cyclobacteriaceae bacterium]